MTRSFPALLLAALLACAPLAALPDPCAATARRPSTDPRILAAIDEARRQNELFGGQRIDRNGGLFHVGFHEAEWDRTPGARIGTWQRVAAFWQALATDEPSRLQTSIGWVGRADATGAAAGPDPTREQVAVREALTRAAIVDIPWSATFISYLMKQAGFTRTEFAFSDSHADYVRAALEASAAEAAGQETAYAFRACDVTTTPPRAGDLLCATRASSAGLHTFREFAAAMAAQPGAAAFPMHCELVVRADRGGDAKIDSIGGNVVQSVTLSRMTLNAKKVLSGRYFPSARDKRENLSRRPWVVVLQSRN